MKREIKIDSSNLREVIVRKLYTFINDKSSNIYTLRIQESTINVCNIYTTAFRVKRVTLYDL